MLVINENNTTTSPRGLKEQTAQEKATAKKILEKINFKNATIVFEINQELFICKMPMERLTANLAISSKKCKFLSPLGKSQVLEFIENGKLEKIGNSSDLEKYHNNPRYKIGNNGHAIEYFIAQKYHTKFDHQGKMTEGSGEFRNTEVKFFSFDKTSGTPSATCESLASLER